MNKFLDSLTIYGYIQQKANDYSMLKAGITALLVKTITFRSVRVGVLYWDTHFTQPIVQQILKRKYAYC